MTGNGRCWHGGRAAGLWVGCVTAGGGLLGRLREGEGLGGAVAALEKGCDRVVEGLRVSQGCIGRWGGAPPPPPSRAPCLCPASVPLTASASLNGICNRQ